MWASQPIFDSNGALLAGNNPASTNFSCQYVVGCLVQILSVGSNSVAHLPNLDGTPSGGDTLVATLQIGRGVQPCILLSGQLDTSFQPHPADGTKIYARVFNATNIAAATHWGQSSIFTVTNAAVFDLSAAGLRATTMPKGVNLSSTFTPKGLTYLQELVAGTDPNDANDVFAVGTTAHTSSQPFDVSFMERAGRMYTLQRTTNELSSANWTNLVTTVPSGTDNWTTISDTSPPDAPKTFYRIKVNLPGF